MNYTKLGKSDLTVSRICMGKGAWNSINNFIIISKDREHISNRSFCAKAFYFHGLPLPSQPCCAHYFPSRYSGSD